MLLTRVASSEVLNSVAKTKGSPQQKDPVQGKLTRHITNPLSNAFEIFTTSKPSTVAVLPVGIIKV